MMTLTKHGKQRSKNWGIDLLADEALDWIGIVILSPEGFRKDPFSG